jgi:hypothetical protein
MIRVNNEVWIVINDNKCQNQLLILILLCKLFLTFKDNSILVMTYTILDADLSHQTQFWNGGPSTYPEHHLSSLVKFDWIL